MDFLTVFKWSWSPGVLISGTLLLAGYCMMNRFVNIRKMVLFSGGLLLTEVALAMPMGPAPHQPFFSLHMIRHIILLMLAPPLLVAGLPEAPVRTLFSKSGIRQWSALLFNPIVTWILGIGIMWFWHIPGIFNGLVTLSGGAGLLLHTVEIVSLVAIGLLFCSPVLFPLKEYRLSPLKGIVYLFTACWGCSILGILITFAPAGLYHIVFSSGVATAWGFTQSVDQQLGGLLMWVPGCVIYVSGAMVLLARWYGQPKTATAPAPKEKLTV